MAFDLNEKPWYWAVGIGVVILIAGFWAANKWLYTPIREEIDKIQQVNQELNREIEKGLAAKRNLPKLREEIKELELELERLLRILPTRKQTPDLIKKLKQLTEAGKSELLKFQPKTPDDREFISAWPISVNLNAEYHELALLFDRLSRFSRIINVADMKLSARAKGEYTISASFDIVTFIYKEDGE